MLTTGTGKMVFPARHIDRSFSSSRSPLCRDDMEKSPVTLPLRLPSTCSPPPWTSWTKAKGKSSGLLASIVA